MAPVKSNLSSFTNVWFNPGAGLLKRSAWYLVSALFFSSKFPINFIKIFLLKIFGATLGTGAVIKPGVQIKFPWKLRLGNHVWIGENVWIDNLEQVTLGSNVCVSQDALLVTGSHDYSKSSFDLLTKPIIIEDGAWVAARAIVTGGVTAGNHSVLLTSSVASANLEPYGVYRGNPAVKIRTRQME